MDDFVLFSGLGGVLAFGAVIIYFIIKNRTRISANFSSQLQAFRWIFAITLSFPTAGAFAIMARHYFGLSETGLIATWIGFYIVWFVLWYLLAKYSITEWFVPFAKMPKLPIPFFPKSKGAILALIIITILMTAYMFGLR